MHRWILLSMLWLSSSLPAWGATFYLNPATGSNSNPGTQAAPWQTLGKVASSVGPGDTVNIQGGTYRQSQYAGGENYFLWTSSHAKGASGQPITIQAAPGETVILDGQQNTYGFYFYATQVTDYYVIVQNLTFRNFRGVAVGIGGGIAGAKARHVAVLNTVMEDFSPQLTGAIAVGHASHYVLRGNRMRNIGDPRLGGSPPPDSQHFIYIGEDSQDGVIDGNVMDGNAGFGIHFWGHSNFGLTTRQSIIRCNTVSNAWDTTMILAGTNYVNTYVYHNSFRQDRVPYPAVDQRMALTLLSWHLSTQLRHTRVLNNRGEGYVQYGAVWSDDNQRFGDDLVLDFNRWQVQGPPHYHWDGAARDLGQMRSAYGYELHSGTDTAGTDAGTFLTVTTTAGSGTQMPVQDAGYFFDGYGLVPGDGVQLEGGGSATVLAVDYGTNTLTLGKPLAWRAGQGVSLPYTGSRPNIGPDECGTSAPPQRSRPYALQVIAQ